MRNTYGCVGFGLLLIFIVTGVFAVEAKASSKNPIADMDLLLSDECRPQALQTKIIRHFSQNQTSAPELELWTEFERLLQSHFDSCSSELKRQPSIRLLDYSKMSSLEYDFQNHPNFRDVDFDVGHGRVVRAKLGLKPGAQKRPLVVFQCGMACQPGTFTSHFASIIFHDMGPFHVLVLPSNSSEAFIKRNKTLALGGLEEGKQIARIAAQIMAPGSKFAKHISRVHVQGISLGGHSTYFAALYTQYLEKALGMKRPMLTGVAVGCPVVDLAPSLRHMASDSLIPKILRMTLLKDFTTLLMGIPFFENQGIERVPQKPSGEELYSLVSEGTFDHYRAASLDPSWALPPMENVEIRNQTQLWDASDVSQWPEGLLQRPVFSWAPSDDEIVLFKDNSEKLYNSQRLHSQRQVYKLSTDQGGHCAYAADFGWGTTSAVLNGLFLAQSPELLQRMKEHRRVLSSGESRRLGNASSRKKRESITLEMSVGSDKVKVRSQFREFPCRRFGGRRPGVCSTSKTVSLPISYFGLKKQDIPSTEIEALSLSRRLNIRTTFYNRYGKPISASENPVSIGTTQY